MSYSGYLLSHMMRHGASIQRLKDEIREPDRFGDLQDPIHAISFDAANFIWSFLASYELENSAVVMERCLRNQIAQEIMRIIEEYRDVDRSELKNEKYML